MKDLIIEKEIQFEKSSLHNVSVEKEGAWRIFRSYESGKIMLLSYLGGLCTIKRSWPVSPISENP
jgi:hypothetical protein